VRVTFWNIQRMAFDDADEVGEDVEGIIDQDRPDVIVLCEGLLGLEQTLQKRGLDDGYQVVATSPVMYRDDDVLRYVVIKGPGAPGTLGTDLIGGPRPPTPAAKYSHSRPMVLLSWKQSNKNRSVLVGHLPAVTNSVTPQSLAVQAALKDCKTKPEAVFGDLNVHLEVAAKAQKFTNTISGAWGQSLAMKNPGEPTHWNVEQEDWVDYLDWLVCVSTLRSKYAVATVVEQEYSTIQDYYAADPNWEAFDPMDLDDSDHDEDEDDDSTFSRIFANRKDSDHRPITVDIS
jgi:hypothetical protein